MTEPLTTATIGVRGERSLLAGVITPLCPHFGTCGGCQYQNLTYAEQLRIKRVHLEGLLQQAGVEAPHEIKLHSADPYGYRNRIRLRIERIDNTTRFGYNLRTTTDFLPITTCPIATPILIQTVESLLAIAATNRDVSYWLNATAEVELFTNDDLSRVQLTLFCAPRTKSPPISQPGHFADAFAALQTHAPQITGAAAMAFDPRTGPTGRTLAEAGASGLNYRVPISPPPDETYWISRGGFFQVNRFLLETLVQLVTAKRSGSLAWDLYAGVGLFSRILARTFTQIAAVESNPTAAADLRSTLAKLSPTSNVIESTTLEFLNRAVLDRDRPDLIVLDPPRAGVGTEACDLLNRIAASTVVYVSCDPTTLARDLAVLKRLYTISALHLVDLFPQTSHLETIVVLSRRA
jgi:23S rRNA (uracil1939-C5)-methyltransferase